MRGQGSKERVQGLGSRSCIVFEGLTRQICAPHVIIYNPQTTFSTSRTVRESQDQWGSSVVRGSSTGAIYIVASPLRVLDLSLPLWSSRVIAWGSGGRLIHRDWWSQIAPANSPWGAGEGAPPAAVRVGGPGRVGTAVSSGGVAVVGTKFAERVAAQVGRRVADPPFHPMNLHEK